MTPKEYWDDYATYCVADGKVGGTDARRAIVQTDLLNQNFTGKLLEVGCGAGINLALFTNITGCDISANMINLSASECPNLFVTNEDNLLPFLTDEFDIVFTVTVLQHVIDNIGVLCAEMIRVGKKVVIYEDIGDGSQYNVYYIRRTIAEYEQLLGPSISRQVDGDLYCLEF